MTPTFQTALDALEDHDDGLRDFPFPNAPKSVAGKPNPSAGYSSARDGHSICWHCQGTGMMHRDRIAKICLSCGEPSDNAPRPICTAYTSLNNNPS